MSILMTNTEKVKLIREKTFSPINRINAALAKANGDIDAAVEILVAEKQADANEMANRAANASIVYSYVHSNRIGAMIVLACQTDFSAKNDLFLNLAKDICMHIVSSPLAPIYVAKENAEPHMVHKFTEAFRTECSNKPPQIQDKIVEGKMKKWYAESCLYLQPFVKDDTKTVGQIINEVSSCIGEKIEVKRFVKIVAQ
jgi:elongation factor Ts